jgi:serine/threonine protein kinase
VRLVMEFRAGGSLKKLTDVIAPFSENVISTVMRTLLRGLDYVYKGRRLHRDSKAANILLSSTGEVKLAVFCAAGQMTATIRQRNTFVGSPFWMASDVTQESAYNENADIWSVSGRGSLVVFCGDLDLMDTVDFLFCITRKQSIAVHFRALEELASDLSSFDRMGALLRRILQFHCCLIVLVY